MMDCNELRERRGTFIVPNIFLGDSSYLERVLSGVTIFRAEQRWDLDAIEYTGASKDFERVPKFEMTPTYRYLYHKGVTAAFDEVRFERVPK